MIEGHKEIEVPAGVPVWDVDPYDPAVLSDPADYYAKLRSKGPFAYISKYSALACGRYQETKEIFSDWERFVSSTRGRSTRLQPGRTLAAAEHRFGSGPALSHQDAGGHRAGSIA